MITTNGQTKMRRIDDLTLREFDMVYSLMRVGERRDSDISRAYKVSVDDVHKIFDNYSHLRAECLRNPPREVVPQASEPELTTKTARKRRSDAQYATTADRQAAYRARLKEKRLEQPSPANETDAPGPDIEKIAATSCQDSVTEASPENADPQPSTCYGSSAECHDISEIVSFPVTPQGGGKRQELGMIEEQT